MSLNIPYNDSRKVAQNNLDKLLGLGTTTKPEIFDILTPVAKEALQDFRDAQLGITHQIKKGCASVVGFAAPVIGIVGTGTASVYYYLNNMDKIHSTDYQNDHNPLINVAANVATVVGPVLLIDFALQKTINRSPLSGLTKWSLSMLSAVGLFASYKASEAVASRYIKMEQTAHEVSIASKKRIFDQELIAFDSIADEIDKSYMEAVRAPKKIYRLKQMVSHLQTKVAIAEKLFKQTPLTSSDVSHITDKLKSTIRSIRDVPFTLATSRKTSDADYNLRLMTTLSDKEFASIAIPRAAMHHAYMVKDNTYGIAHNISTVAKTLGYSAASVFATGAGVFGLGVVAAIGSKVYGMPQADQCMESGTDCVGAQLLGGTAAVAGVYIGYQTFIQRNHSDKLDKIRAEKAVIEHTKEAGSILLHVYNDIANLLIDIHNNSNTIEGGRDKVRNLAGIVKGKLSGIENAVKNLGILPDPATVTAGLRETVAKILE